MRIPTEDIKNEEVSVFQALSNRHRRDIVYLLQIQSYSISDLAVLLEISLPAIHKHIKVLKESDLIEVKKISRTRYAYLNKAKLRTNYV